MTPQPIVLLPGPLVVEFSEEIRLGELLCTLGPSFIARGLKNGRVQVEKSKQESKEEIR